MSAPSPVKAPERVSPRLAPAAPRRRSPWKLLLAIVATAAVGVGLYQGLKTRQAQKAVPVVVIPTATIKAGPLERTIRVSGQTSARIYANIMAPMMRGVESSRSLQLIQLAKSGVIVKKGDLLAKIDSQAQEDHIDDVKDLVANAENDVLRRRAQQAVEWGQVEQTLRMAKANLDSAKEDARAAEVRTAIERELLELSVSENDANYTQLQKNLALKRAEFESEIKILEITLQQQRDHLDRHQTDVKKMTIYAPMPGLVVMQSIYRYGEYGQIQVGDMIYPGQPFMKVVQTDNMQVEASINQTQSEEFRLGQTARIGFDAFPGLYIKGKVYSIGAMGIGSWRTNYFIRDIPIRITLDGSDPHIIPDLSASCDVLVGKVDHAVLVPLDAVQRENGKPVVFVKQPQGFERREVRLGMRSLTQAAVLAGLQAGDVVALRRPN